AGAHGGVGGEAGRGNVVDDDDVAMPLRCLTLLIRLGLVRIAQDADRFLVAEDALEAGEIGRVRAGEVVLVTHARARSRGSRSDVNRSRKRFWSCPGAWKTRWLRPASTYFLTCSTASSGSEATIQRLATCSIGNSSARRSISRAESTECFCSGVRDSGAQKRQFSSAA